MKPGSPDRKPAIWSPPTKPYKFTGFGAMEVTKPYEFIGFGAMEVTKPYEFIGVGAMEVTKPYKFIGFGAMEVPKPIWSPPGSILPIFGRLPGTSGGVKGRV